MARAPVDTAGPTVLLQPQAAPVQSYVQPQRSSLEDFAQSLGQLDKSLGSFLEQRTERRAKEDAIRGEAAFYTKNDPALAEGVRTGRIPAQYSPAFVRAYKRTQGSVAGVELSQKFSAAFDAWGGKNSEDPAAYDTFVQDFLKQNIGTEDPEVLAGLLPHIRQIEQNGAQAYTAYRSDQTYKGSLNAHVASANQTIEQANKAGLATEEGTNYAQVYSAIAERRADFVAKGGKPEDFDKSMIDSVSAKTLALRDPGLLGFFDQKVPGTDYTYGESPYGAQKKKETEESLEVIARRYAAEEYTKQTREDAAKKDAYTQQAIEIIAQDPSAPIPDELMREAEKVDPKFRVNVEEWRRSLNTGFTDKDDLRGLYSEILNGGGVAAVVTAANNGVFGTASDMSSAFAFAKSYEENKGSIDKVLSGSTATRIMTAIDVRTKGRTQLGDPLSGMSNEGFEASYDFRTAVQEWVVRNPDATQAEREEALSKIGKSILDNISGYDEMAVPGAKGGTYNRPENAPFDNPYSPSGDGGQPKQPQAPEKRAETAKPQVDTAQAQSMLDGLTPEQRKTVEDMAATKGVDPVAYVQQGLSSPTPADSGEPDTSGDTRQSGFTPEQATQFLDEAIAQANAAPSSNVNVPDARAASLLDLIGQNESNGNYNAVYGNADSKRDLGKLTLDQVLAEQAIARGRGVKSTAIGKYQIIYGTLRGLKKALGLTGKERFNRALQDRLAMALLKRRGWDAFVAGKLSKRAFALRLAQEWASLPNPATGQSYYQGDGLNAAGTSTAEVYKALGFG